MVPMPHSFPIDPDRSSRARRRAKAEQQVDVKSLGARIGDVRFDPNAEDGDGDGLVQDNTAYERPSVPGVRQAVTGNPRRTAEGVVKPQSALTPEDIRNIEHQRDEEQALVGMRSQAAKPTGGKAKPIQRDANGVRTLVPDIGRPYPGTLDWLRDMSDEEIADAIVPTSFEDFIAMITILSEREKLLGLKFNPQMKAALEPMVELLEEYGAPQGLSDKVRTYLRRDYSRDGTFDTKEVLDEINTFLDSEKAKREEAVRNAETDEEKRDADEQMERFQEFAAEVSVPMQGFEVITDYETVRLQQHMQNSYAQYYALFDIEGDGYDFSAAAQSDARKIVIDALQTSPAFAWAVRTYGAPPVRVVTPQAKQRLKNDPRGDIRSPTLKDNPGGWFGHVQHVLGGIALNLSERSMARDIRPGATRPIQVDPAGTGVGSIPGNVGFSRADVLRHEWGHFFYYMFTRNNSEDIFDNSGRDTSVWASMSRRLRKYFAADKGEVYNGAPRLRSDSQMTLQDLENLLSKDNEIARSNLTRKEADKMRLQIAQLIEDQVKQIEQMHNFKTRILPNGPLGLNPDGTINAATQHLLSAAKMNPFIPGYYSEKQGNPLFNPYVHIQQSRDQGIDIPFVSSVYGFTDPQETWAEGIAAFMSPLPQVRALNNNAMRTFIAQALGLQFNADGKHDKPWERFASGDGTIPPKFWEVPEPMGTPSVDEERSNLPIPEISQNYPPEVGGMRSRIELKKRAETLGVDVSLYNDTSRDDDDIMWATNDWALSKTSRVEAGDAVIVRQGDNGPEVLLVTRSKGPFRESLALPGGIRQSDESLDASAMREAMEEVGVSPRDATRSTLLGEIETRDWDPRFVEGGRIAGVRMDVPADIVPRVGDDAESYQWVPVDEIANGKHAIAFGHATWIAEAFRGDSALYEKLSIVSEASRVRNRRIISAVDRERAKKGLKQFGPLPDPNAPYPTVYVERRLGMRSTTPSGVPQSTLLRNDRKLESMATQYQAQLDGSVARLAKLNEAYETLKRDGEWRGADIGVSITPGGSPTNLSREEIASRDMIQPIIESLEDEIARATEFSEMVTRSLDAVVETLARRKTSPTNTEELDDIRTDRRTYVSLLATSKMVEGMDEEQVRSVFNRDGVSYVVSMREREPGSGSARTIDVRRVQRPQERWNGLFDNRDDGEVIVSMSFRHPEDVEDIDQTPASAIVRGWAKQAMDRDIQARQQPEQTGPTVVRDRAEDLTPQQIEAFKQRQEQLRSLSIGELNEIFTDGEYTYVIHAGSETIDGDTFDPARASGQGRDIRDNTRMINTSFADKYIAKHQEELDNQKYFNKVLDRLKSGETIEISDSADNRAMEGALSSQRLANVISSISTKDGPRFFAAKLDGETTFPSQKYLDALGITREELIDYMQGVGIPLLDARVQRRQKIVDQLIRDDKQFNSSYPIADIAKGASIRGYGGRYGEGDGREGESDTFSLGARFNRQGIHIVRVRVGENADRLADAPGVTRVTKEMHLVGRHEVLATLSTPTWAKSSLGGDKSWTLGEDFFLAWAEDFVKKDKARRRQDGSDAGMRSSTSSESLSGEIIDYGTLSSERSKREALDTIPEIERYINQEITIGEAPRERIEKLREILESIALSDFSKDSIGEKMNSVRRELAEMVISGLFNPNKGEDRAYMLYQDAVDVISDILTQAIVRDITDEDKLEEIQFLVDDWSYELKRRADKMENEIIGAGRGEFGATEAVRGMLSSTAPADFERLMPTIAEGYRKEAERMASDAQKLLSPEGIENVEVVEQMEPHKKRLLESIRVVVENGMPMLMAEPHPVFRDAIPWKIDWSKIRQPSEEAMSDIIKQSKSSYRSITDRTDAIGRYSRGVANLFEKLVEPFGEYSGPGYGWELDFDIGTFMGLYIASVSHPRRAMGEPLGTPDLIHDAFGHIGTGRGFDRHGEWANLIAMVSFVDMPELDFTPQEKEIVTRYLMENYLPRGFDRALLRTRDETYDISKMFELMVQNSLPADTGMRSRTSGTPSVRVSDAPQSLLSNAIFDDFVSRENMRLRGGMRSRTPKKPRSVQEFDKAFKEEYGEEPPEGDGDCFEAAIFKARELADTYEDVRVVHGVPLGTGGEAEGLRFPHAWVEFTQMIGDFPVEFVADFSNGNEVIIPKQMYYQIGNIDPDFNKSFDVDEVERLIDENGHAGPW